MNDPIPRLLVGCLAAVTIALVGYRRRALSRDGAAAAVVLGTAVVAAGGWWWGGLVVIFFASSTLLGRLRPPQGSPAAQPIRQGRGSRRDAVQVLANGGLAALLAILAPFADRPLLFAAFAGAIAAAAADTWATELGRLSRRPPRLLTTLHTVVPGISGGVTPLGLTASAAGGLLIAALAALGVWLDVAPRSLAPAWLALAVASAGLVGSLLDSLLGATVQALYHCPTCEEPTERRLHTCGTPTVLRRGNPFVTNDLVNATATLGGAGLAALAVALG